MAWQRWRRDGRQNPQTRTNNKRVSLVWSTLLHSDIWALDLFNSVFNDLLACVVVKHSEQAFSAPVSYHTVPSVSLSYLSSSVFSVCLFMLSQFSVLIQWLYIGSDASSPQSCTIDFLCVRNLLDCYETFDWTFEVHCPHIVLGVDKGHKTISRIEWNRHDFVHVFLAGLREQCWSCKFVVIHKGLITISALSTKCMN